MNARNINVAFAVAEVAKTFDAESLGDFRYDNQFSNGTHEEYQ